VKNLLLLGAPLACLVAPSAFSAPPNITCFDSQVGELLALLDRYGQRDNTLAVVLSEQGNSFPFAKWTCYDVGLRSGCLVRAELRNRLDAWMTQQGRRGSGHGDESIGKHAPLGA